MADITLSPTTVFPVGTSIAAYPRSNWPAFVNPSGTPILPFADADTMTSTGVVFNGLIEGERYVVAGLVNGEYRYVGFYVALTPPMNADLAAHIANTSNPHAVTKAQVGLGNVTNDAQLKVSDKDTDGTLAANSDTKIASQKATKTYADTKVPKAGGTMTGALWMPSGSNTAPAIAASNDTNTGPYFSGPDSYSIATGGTEAIRLKNTDVTIMPSRVFKPIGGLSVTGKLLIGSNPDCSNAPNYERYMDLQADISSTATSCSVNNVTDGYGSAVALPSAPFLLHMDDEMVVVSAVSGAGPYTLTFGARHALSTTAADHYAGSSSVYLTDTDDFLILQGAVRTAFANQVGPINAWLPPISTVNGMSPPTNGQVFKVEDAGNAGGTGPIRIRDWPSGSTIDVTINVNFASATFIFNASQLRYTLDAKSY